ncbi:MAG: aromatic ring-hydroxylating dioxygenase subunit alpha [Zavarzinia sp.]|nr:aromatic ring-hydroxylating dioxygenase subunit alpha [Zavarzinia sp.]
MFVKNCWYVAGWDYDLPQGKVLARTIIDQPLALYRREDGSVVAMEDRCCHRQAALHLGEIEGDCLRCMYHGMKFDPSGRCVDIPGQDIIPVKARVRTYPVIERDNWIWVWMGDPALADPALVPFSVGPGDPDWDIRPSSLVFDADYRLVIDNLLDFSHLTYVHRKTFGGDEFSRSLPTITRLDRGMRVERWVRNVPALVFVQHIMDGRYDMLTDYSVVMPCVFVMRFQVYSPGTATEGPSNGQLLLDTWTCQSVVPVSAGQCIYYFSWGASKATATPEIGDLLYEGIHKAFLEDKEMIEAQYRNIRRDPGRPNMSTAHDVAVNQMHALMKRHIAEETTGVAAE